MQRVLFVTPEIYPLNKVGGLGDFSHGLVNGLMALGLDIRVVLPGFAKVKQQLIEAQPITTLMGRRSEQGCLIQAHIPESDALVYVVDIPALFDDSGSPYAGRYDDGDDDGFRYFEYARQVARLALGKLVQWQPDIVHCNDWTTGMVPALLAKHEYRPATLFTIHNLAYQGLFSRACFDGLELSEHLWSMHALEFYDRMSFMKGGLVFSDQLNTVSETYAKEILTPSFGNGLEGVLQEHAEQLSGVVNGVDYSTWDPNEDTNIPHAYSPSSMVGKRLCKEALQKELKLSVDEDAPLLGIVSRLTHQKGIDLIVEQLPALLAGKRQLVVLGTGDPALEQQLIQASVVHSGRLAVNVGYSEALAHRIIAGADMFLMPSRFEPCGLTQLYCLKYGTVPIAHRTGGLADTIIDATTDHLTTGDATGLLFEPLSGPSLLAAVERAETLYRGSLWSDLQATGMRQNFSWQNAAHSYRDLYIHTINTCARNSTDISTA